MPEGVPKPHELRLETPEEERQRLSVETAPELKEAQKTQGEREQAVETVAAPDPATVERKTVDATDLAATRERLGMPSAKASSEVSPVDSERAQELAEQLESLKVTGGKSAERLRNIFDEVNGNTELFGGSSERSKRFMSRIIEKANELRSGPELMRKKEEFWDKWKKGSLLTASAGAIALAGGAAWTAKYGFDHTYLTEILGQSWNLPMIAGFAGGAIAEGSMGIAKLMEMWRGKKSLNLQRTLENSGVNYINKKRYG
ncbi:hypothetical protein HKL94_00150 [Candidatus Parcubacteria bacterium]|nr:hypothetical protein [Candidatus Parcubacteria bacterium]